MVPDFFEQLSFLANRLDWRSGIDIAMIAVGVLLLYRTVRRSGSYQILIGILIAVALIYAATLLNLSAIPWIFSKFADVFIILLIILFQPELRRLFARAATWRWRRSRGARSGVVLTIGEAVEAIRAREWGALFVFPGSESVDPWLSGGFPGDAQPTAAMLVSIFDPGSPGHDGAALIEDGRIARFGSRLPLSASGRLPPTLGTRHHAAMGLSEEVDALVVAVSEERGEISLFRSGRHEVLRSREELEERLATHLGQSGWSGGRGLLGWRGALELVGSALFGLMIWGAIVFSEGRLEEIEVTVPLRLRSEPAGLNGSLSNRGVRLTLSGPRDILRDLDEGTLVARMNLSRLTPGTHSLRIGADDLNLPEEIRLLKAEPAVVNAKLEPASPVALSVRPRLIGELPDEYILEDVRVEPRQLRVYSTDPGEMATRTEVFTAALDLSQIARELEIADGEGTWRGTVELDPPANLRSAAADWEWPELRISIRVRSLEREPSPEFGPESESATPDAQPKKETQPGPSETPANESATKPTGEPDKEPAPKKEPPANEALKAGE